MADDVTIIGWAVSACSIVGSAVMASMLAKARGERDAVRAASEAECVDCASAKAERDAAIKRADRADASVESRHKEVVDVALGTRDALVTTGHKVDRLVDAVTGLATDVRDALRDR